MMRREKRTAEDDENAEGEVGGTECIKMMTAIMKYAGVAHEPASGSNAILLN
jgi:hypothetical protein